ncbi:MAG: helix-turn-helix transcriptional regulator [Bacteroidales bacterium]|nr:helix-turn-helix transcriptional regulator [Bacteroidales bacterium]
MTKMTLTPFEDILDGFYGKIGTPKRDEHERQVNEAVQIYKIGEAIKKARLEQQLTQKELGAKAKVNESQISRLEHGYSVTIPILSRVFRALGIMSATLDLGSYGRLNLW